MNPALAQKVFSVADYDLAVEGQSPGPTETVHRNIIAGLFAVNEFMDNLGSTSEKRTWIQANRKRTDAELFHLFGKTAQDPTHREFR